MRFLHTADWQLGSGSTPATQAARFTAVENIIHLASQHSVDFVLIAGDTFEHPNIDLSTLEATAALFARFHCPLYLIPGNHDPATPDGIWTRPLWRSIPNLHVFLNPVPHPIPGGTLLPCPLRDRYQSSNPTAWLATAPSDGLRIALAHGNLQINIPNLEKSEPIFPNIIQHGRLDYLALGHWHSTFTFPSDPRLAYSGTHETTRFGENDSGNVLLVTPGEAPKSLRSGHLNWLSQQLTLHSLADLRAYFASLPSPANTLLRLALSGALPPAELEQLPSLLESQALVQLLVDRERLYSQESAVELPTGLLSQLAEALERQAANDATAARALANLQRYAREQRA